MKDLYTGLATGRHRVISSPASTFPCPPACWTCCAGRASRFLTWAVSDPVPGHRHERLNYKTPDRVRQVLFSGGDAPCHLRAWRKAPPNARCLSTCTAPRRSPATACTTWWTVDLCRRRAPAPGHALPQRTGVPFGRKQRPGHPAGRPGRDLRGGQRPWPWAITTIPAAPRPCSCRTRCTTPTGTRGLPHGDLAGWATTASGTDAARRDFQIKHMGHRIELGTLKRPPRAGRRGSGLLRVPGGPPPHRGLLRGHGRKKPTWPPSCAKRCPPSCCPACTCGWSSRHEQKRKDRPGGPHRPADEKEAVRLTDELLKPGRPAGHTLLYFLTRTPLPRGCGCPGRWPRGRCATP